MNLTYYFSILLLSSLPIISQAQDVKSLEVDERIIEVYGEDYVNTLKTENPFLLKRWNFYLENAFYITDVVSDKPGDYKSVVIEDMDHVNILKLEKEQNIGKSWDLPSVYKIENSEKLLVYYPGKKFNEKLKAHLEKE